MRTIFVGVFLFTIACGPGASRLEPGASSPGKPPGVNMAVMVPVPERPGAPHIPHLAVHVTVAGHEALLVVDTGAQGLVLDTEVAAQAGLVTADSGIDGRGWNGQPMKMLRTDHPQLAIAGLGPIADRPVAVTAFPPGFRARGLGGALSPQWLATATSDVMVDMPNQRLVVRERSLPPAPPFGTVLGHEAVCLDASGGMQARSITVTVDIAGVSKRLAIDTGAEDTILFASVAGAPDGARAATTLSAGTWTRSVDAVITPGTSNRACPFDGRLGLDVLGSCVVMIAERDSTLRCAP